MKTKQRESVTENYLVSRVEALGGMALKLHAVSVAGIPDRLVLLPKGKLLFIELKSEGKNPRKLQLYTIARLRALGIRVEVVDTKELIDKILTEYENE